MNTLELFELPDFGGQQKTLSGDMADLNTVKFLQKAQSLKVHSDPWIVFSDAMYEGRYKAFPKGDYKSLSHWNKKISSARIVRGGLDNPKITLYENVKYKGTTVTLSEEAESLKEYGFQNVARSQNDVSGAWVLYSDGSYEGNHNVTVAGDDIPDYLAAKWGFNVASLKPITSDWACAATE